MVKNEKEYRVYDKNSVSELRIFFFQFFLEKNWLNFYMMYKGWMIMFI